MLTSVISYQSCIPICLYFDVYYVNFNFDFSFILYFYVNNISLDTSSAHNYTNLQIVQIIDLKVLYGLGIIVLTHVRSHCI